MAAPRTSRDKVLSDPRSGAKPLGNSDPGPGRATNDSAPRSEPRTVTVEDAPRSSAPPREAPSSPSSSGSDKPLFSSRASKGGLASGNKKVLSPKNYQAIVIGEFIAAELLAAMSPIASKKNPGGMSPYASQDIVKMFAIGLVYFILAMLASAGSSAARFSAWFGGLILLTVGLSEAANIAGVFSALSGGSGKAVAPSTTATPVSATEAAIQSAPQITTSEPATGGTGGGGGHGGGGGGGGPVTGKTGSSFVQEASKFIGTPYKFGGESPKGFDCSGLVDYALTKLGVRNVPRTSEEQWKWVKKIPFSQLQAGDLVFEQWPGDQAAPGHVAIYAGNGKIIQAPQPGESVQEVSWSPSQVHAAGGKIVGYGRVPGLAYAGSGIPPGGIA